MITIRFVTERTADTIDEAIEILRRQLRDPDMFKGDRITLQSAVRLLQNGRREKWPDDAWQGMCVAVARVARTVELRPEADFEHVELTRAEIERAAQLLTYAAAELASPDPPPT